MNEQGFAASQRWVLELTAAAASIAVMDGMVVTTALDSIRRDLAAPLSYLHWTMTAYSLSFASLLMAGAAFILHVAIERIPTFRALHLTFRSTKTSDMRGPTSITIISSNLHLSRSTNGSIGAGCAKASFDERASEPLTTAARIPNYT